MKRKIIFSLIICTVFIVGATYAPYFKLPETWTSYSDTEIGISFKHPGTIEGNDSGQFAIASDNPNVLRMIEILRLFGYATQETSEHIVELLKLDPILVSQKITIDNRDAVLVTEPYDEDVKTIYVLVDDALFVIKVYGINVERFYKSLVFTKTQSIPDFSVIKIDEQKKRFINLNAGYQIDIPSNFGYEADNNNVVFTLPFDGPFSGISIHTSTTTDDPSVKYFMDPTKYTFEKNIKIDGVNATVKHAGNINTNGEEFPYSKYVYFLKGEYHYIINTQHADHGEVWNSFKFLK